MRLSALSELGVIYVLTHDSIGVGEDGPTHQPIETIPSLRAMQICLFLDLEMVMKLVALISWQLKIEKGLPRFV